MTNFGPYKLRVIAYSKGKPSAVSITIPLSMARQIPENTHFMPEWHEDGILLRAVANVKPESETPAWTRKEEGTS